MRFHEISKDNMNNGDGLRAVLWVAGCTHYCKGCQNPVTWDPLSGLPFDYDAEQELWSYLDADYCSGLTLSGGDPMYQGSRREITKLCQKFRDRYGDSKTIWMYTGYTYDEVKDEPVMQYIDVLVDGEFEEDKKSAAYMWAGSTNQRIWRKVDGVFKADPPTFEKSLNEINCECERGEE